MSRKNAPASLFVVLVLVNICSGFRWGSKLKKENAEYVQITLQPGSERTRRSVGMPNDLHFRFSMADKDMEVRLRRSVTKKDSKHDVTTNNFPLFVIENGTISREPLPPVQTAAIYENDTLGQLFVVRRKHELDGYLLEGVFYDAAFNPYHVIPDQHGYHWIHKQDMVVDFRGDYIDNTVPGSNKSSSTSDSTTTSSHRRKRHTRLSRILGLSQNFVDRQLQSTVNKKGDNMHERSERAKRQATSHYEIELFMVADFRDYFDWLSYYNGNITQTAMEMHIFYSFVANWISQRYRSIPNVDPTLKIDILTTGLLIVKSPTDSYWTEKNLHVIHTKAGRAVSVEAGRALEAFRRWIDDRPDSLPDSDHWMLFTGFDIYTLNGDETNLHVAGLAKLGGLCTYNSVSIIEQDNTASVGATAAHELGHSLSARHDGELKGCKDEDNYIMSRKLKTPDVENLASRPWQFSPCSVRAFRHFLSRMKCGQIERHGTNFLTTELQGGQVFSADLQCQLALGKYSYFGRRVHHVDRYQSMCRRMFCAVPLQDADGYFQAIFAMEKTTCGDGKWCVQGKCTSDINAPRALDNCPQGDSPNFRCRRHYCHLYQPHHRNILCCKTCQERPPVNNFIYSLANSPVQIETVTRRVPAIPDFEPPPTTTTTTTTTPSPTTTIAETSPLPSTSTPSSEPTANRTTTPSVTSVTSRMTSSTTLSSVVGSASATSSTSPPASKLSGPDATSSPVASGENSSPNSTASQTSETSPTTSPSTTTESVPLSTASAKTHTHSTQPAKMAADMTSPKPDFVTTTSSEASNAATDVTARSTPSLSAGNADENAVVPQANGDTSTRPSQLANSGYHSTATAQNTVVSETSAPPLQSSERPGGQNSAADSLQEQSYTAKPSDRNEIVAGKAGSSPQDTQHADGTQSSAASDTGFSVTTESTANLQAVDGMNPKSSSAQNVALGDNHFDNSSTNASDASSTALDGFSVTSSTTNDSVGPWEQTMTSGRTSQTASESSLQAALSSSVSDLTTPTPSVQLPPADGSMVLRDTGTTPLHSADTSPEGTTPLTDPPCL